MKHKLKPLEEQTIVITGGSSGIGLATAKMAAGRGANVVIISRDEDGMDKICDEIHADGGRCDYVVCDVAKREDVRRAVETVIDRHGGFDSWINNAGVAAFSRIEDISDEDHERVMQVNYWGVVYGSTEALKHLRKKGGALINTGSLSSEIPSPVLSTYAASKFAVKGFTHSLRHELMYDKVPVSVTLIQPSGIHTPFGNHALNYMDHASKVPPPVYAPELVAEAMCYAAENPIRSIMVGGSGLMLTWASRLFPRLSDKLFSKAFFLTAVDRDRPPREEKGGFHKPGSSGELYGDQRDYMRKTSIATTFQTHPKTTAAAAAAAGLAGAVLTAWLLKPEPQGEQKPVPKQGSDDEGTPGERRAEPRAQDMRIASARERQPNLVG